MWYEFLYGVDKNYRFTELILTVLAIGIAIGVYCTTVEQVRIQEKFGRIEARAYICYDDIASYRLRINKPKKIEINFINTGKTPAHEFRSESKVMILDTPKEVSQIDVDNITTSKKKGRVVGTGQTLIVVTDTCCLSLEDSLSIFRGKKCMFVYGRIFYEDVFGEPHFTNYCINFRADRFRFLLTTYGNNADQYEKNQTNN
jgi:hypothetical protein